MGLPLYLLISGDILYLGLGLLAAGAMMAAWRPGVGSGLAWGGVVLAIASAVPFHSAAYVILMLTALAWQVSLKHRPNARHAAAVAVCAVVALVACSGLALRSHPKVALPRDTAVFVLGDSISAGLGASAEGTWPQLLAARLHLRILNLARAGATLVNGPAQARAIPEGPAIILVELGGNDLLAGATPEKFESDLRSLLSGLVGEGRKVLMFELPLLPLQNAFGRIQRDACRQYDVTLLPRSVLAGAVALPGHASDGLHLSPQGHSWLAERVSRIWLGA